MFLVNVLRGRHRRSMARRKTAKPWHASRRRLVLEGLEERELLSYSFTLIADTSGRYLIESLPGAGPKIDNSGRVGFLAGLEGGSQALFTGDGGDLTTIADTYGRFTSLGMAFQVSDGESGVFGPRDRNGVLYRMTYDGQSYTTIADTSSGVFAGFSSNSMNMHGLVVTRANLTDGSQRIIMGRGGPLTTIATTGARFGSLGVIGDTGPVLNDEGTVAFQATLTAGGEGVFLWAHGWIDTLVNTKDGFQDFGLLVDAARPSISNDGTVLFFANLLPKGAGLFTRRAGEEIQTIVTNTEDSPFREFGTSPGINTHGQVAFRAVLREGGHCMMTGPDLKADKVLCTGDELFGSTVLGRPSFFDGINDAGQIAFRVALEDGRTVIVRADPDGEAAAGSEIITSADYAAVLNLFGRAILPAPAVTVWANATASPRRELLQLVTESPSQSTQETRDLPATTIRAQEITLADFASTAVDDTLLNELVLAE